MLWSGTLGYCGHVLNACIWCLSASFLALLSDACCALPKHLYDCMRVQSSLQCLPGGRNTLLHVSLPITRAVMLCPKFSVFSLTAHPCVIAALTELLVRCSQVFNFPKPLRASMECSTQLQDQDWRFAPVWPWQALYRYYGCAAMRFRKAVHCNISSAIYAVTHCDLQAGDVLGCGALKLTWV